jgi:hypothetical protein
MDPDPERFFNVDNGWYKISWNTLSYINYSLTADQLQLLNQFVVI